MGETPANAKMSEANPRNAIGRGNRVTISDSIADTVYGLNKENPMVHKVFSVVTEEKRGAWYFVSDLIYNYGLGGKRANTYDGMNKEARQIQDVVDSLLKRKVLDSKLIYNYQNGSYESAVSFDKWVKNK